MAPVAGSVELKLPIAILEKCQLLQSGETLELYGTNLKQGGSKRHAKSEPVKIIAEKDDTFLSLHLKTSAMGTVFQRKVTETWNCEIKTVSAYEEEEIASFVLKDTNEPLLETLSQEAELALNTSQPDTIISISVKTEHPTKDDEEDDDDVEPLDDTNTYNMTTDVVTEDLDEHDEEAVPGTSSTGDYSQEMTESTQDNKKEITEIKNDTCPEETDAASESSHTRSKSIAKVEAPATRSTSRNQRSKNSETSEPVGKAAAKRKSSSTRNSKRPRKEADGAGVADLRCKYCDRSWFMSSKGYNRHLNRCTKNPEVQASDRAKELEEELFTCEICNMTTKSQGMLKRHKREIHNIQTVKTPPRGPKKRRHNKPDPRPCKYCGEIVSKWRNSQREHSLYKCEQNPNVVVPKVCPLCYGKFESDAALEKHKAKNHSGVSVIICDMCGKQMKSRSSMYFHKMRFHNDGVPGKYECPHCDKRFLTGDHLARHQITHSDKRQYICHLCGKGFKHDGGVKRHVEQAHQNKYRYHCAKCGHGMEKLSYVQSHICGRVRRGVKMEDGEETCEVTWQDAKDLPQPSVYVELADDPQSFQAVPIEMYSESALASETISTLDDTTE